MRILDLCCGAGGAAVGLHRAFPDAEIVGVDVRPQPRYPFTFVQGDALEFDLTGFDFVWASPPCQAYSALKPWNARQDHPDLVAPMRDKLLSSGLPYIIENVPGAPLRNPIVLCGSMFGLHAGKYQLRRHRWFETSPEIWFRPPCAHRGAVLGVYGDHARDRRRRAGGDLPDGNKLTIAGSAMGIDWMNWQELSQAVPPTYSLYLAQFIPLPVERAA